MLAASRRLVAPSIAFGKDIRTSRLAQEHSKLAQAFFNLVSTDPRLIPLGPDPLVEQLLSAKGLSKYDTASLRLSANGIPVSAICVPRRVWRDPDARRAIYEVKVEASATHTRCLMVPQGWVRGTIRSQVARLLALSRNVRVAPEHSDPVLDHVRKHGLCTLMEASSFVVGHKDPIGVVLALCARGDLFIERHRQIDGTSLVATRISARP